MKSKLKTQNTMEVEVEKEDLERPWVDWDGPMPSNREEIERYLEECQIANACPYAAMFKDWYSSFEERQWKRHVLIAALHELRVVPRNPNKALYCAIVFGKLRDVRLLLELGIGDPMGRLRDGRTMLHAIAEHAYEGRSYHANKTNIVFPVARDHLNSRDMDDYSPLAYALEFGNKPAFEFFIRQGATLDRPGHSKHSMVYAAINGSWSDGGDRGKKRECRRAMAAAAYAYGSRELRADRECGIRDPFVIRLQDRVSICGEATMVILGLRVAGSRVCGPNNRDALRLVARMVWVYRVDEVWEDEDQSDNGDFSSDYY